MDRSRILGVGIGLMLLVAVAGVTVLVAIRGPGSSLIRTLAPLVATGAAVVAVGYAIRTSGDLRSEDRKRSPWTLRQQSLFIGIPFLVVEVALLVIAWWGMRSLLGDIQNHALLGPADAPAIVGSITALATAIGTLTGAILFGFSRLTRARGYADAERTRAEADMVRAQAELERARSESIRANGSHNTRASTALPSRLSRKRRSLPPA